MHDNDGISWLSISRNLADPARERQDTVACHGPDETRACDTSDGGVENETKNADYDHDYLSSLAHCHGVEIDKWLRCAKGVQGVQVWSTEQVEDDDWKAQNTGYDSR